MSEEYPVPTDPWNASEPDETPEQESGTASGEPGAENVGTAHPGDDEAPPVGIRSGESASDATATSTPQTEADLPPEAQGEANGGPLGCCLGVTIGIVLSLMVAVFGRLYIANPVADMLHDPLLTLILLRVAMGVVTLGVAILCGIFGWKFGKKLFREYEQPVVPVKPKRKRRKAKIRPKEAS